MKQIAIYSRMSNLNSNSDVDLCKEYIYNNFDTYDHNVIVYEDTGSGLSTDRLMLQQLLEDVSNDKVDTIVVSSIDRISRSAKQFASIEDILNENNVSVINISEKI